MPKNFYQSLIAVVVGNLIYFLAMPYLPRLAQHATYKIDFGLIVDFWVCLVVYGILEMLKRWRWRRRQREI